MVGRDDQAASPLIDRLRREQHRHAGEQSIPTRLCKAHQ
jgi:hypothetical protein